MTDFQIFAFINQLFSTNRFLMKMCITITNMPKITVQSELQT